MQTRNTSSELLLYVGVIATALAIIALGLTTVVKASTTLSPEVKRDKTVLELQVESSREIRRALATSITVPPLAPISSHLREMAAAQLKKPTRTAPTHLAMDAMAMDQSGTYSPTVAQTSPVAIQSTATRDRHSANW